MAKYFRSDQNPFEGTAWAKKEHPPSKPKPKKELEQIPQQKPTTKPKHKKLARNQKPLAPITEEPYPVGKFAALYEENKNWYDLSAPPKWENPPRTSWEANQKAFIISLMEF